MIRRVLVAAASGLLGLVLAGCGTGQDAATKTVLSSIPGVDADASGVAVRNARIPFAEGGYPAGGTAPIEMSVVNTGTEPLQLLELSSPAASSVTMTAVSYVDVPRAAGDPPDGGDQPQLMLPAGGLANLRLQAGGLAEELDATGPLPLLLSFDSGAVLELDVPTAPPDQPLPREPMELGEEASH